MENAESTSTIGGLKVQMSPKVIAIILAVLGVGGGAGFFSDLFYGGKANNGINEVQASQDSLASRMHRIENEQIEQRTAIQTLTTDVHKILKEQITSTARTEARRLTVNIENRTKREEAYDFLFLRNMERLRKGAPPCSTLTCNERLHP